MSLDIAKCPPWDEITPLSYTAVDKYNYSIRQRFLMMQTRAAGVVTEGKEQALLMGKIREATRKR